MKFRVFKINSANGRNEYLNLLSSFNVKEPYCLLDYIDIFSGGLDNLVCFSFVSDITNSVVLMPGYLKPIIIGEEKTDYFDFITPYGYTGPFFSENILDSDMVEFWKLVDEWYLQNNVVTEFIRFNLSGNNSHYSGDVFPTMLNIKGQIIEEDKQWSLFDRKVRKNYNKANRENLLCRVFYVNIEDNIILEFYNIYIQTMERTNAKDSFFYTFDQFKKFININKRNAAICTIYLDQIAISSELLLVSEDSIYSFLGGTDDKYFDKRPNDFLKVEALNWARKQNIKYYVLGGGYGFEDGIFKYKKSFFPNDVVNYYTGRKVINEEVYTSLVNETNKYNKLNGLQELQFDDTSFFPLYNKKN